MEGKIFKESSNIYQDEAKILFDYYRQAAEKIVAEEEYLERQIAGLQQEQKELTDDLASKWWLKLLFYFPWYFKKKNVDAQVQERQVRIDEFARQHDEIFRDYKVTKLGVAYVPIADQIKYEKNSFIVDYTGQVPQSEVTVQVSRQNELLIDTIERLNKLSQEAPIVETSEDVETLETDSYSTTIQEVNQHDYIGSLERSLRTISYCMSDLDTTSVSLPLVKDNSQYLESLNEYATSNIPTDAVVIPVFNKERYADKIQKFQDLNKLKDSLSSENMQFEDALKGLMMTVANSVQTISTLKIASADKMIFNANKVLFQILKSPYNHYSPLLEHEEIERIRLEKFDYSGDVQGYEPFQLKQSSRVRYNLTTGMWTAEDGSSCVAPFGMHQLYEEILAPVVQNLMAETRIERLKIYNHIKDQKISYLNKWHQDTEAFYRANRAESSDIINLMQESLRQYVAAYNTVLSLKKTEDSMKVSGSLGDTTVHVEENSDESIAAFEMQSKEFQRVQNDFEQFMERLKEDIDTRAEKFGHVEYYDARLRDGVASEMAVASSEVSSLDDRRKPLALVSPLLAKTSEMLPEPNVEDITFEQMSINLPLLAKNVLEELDNMEMPDMTPPAIPVPEDEEPEDEVPEGEEPEDEEPEAEEPEDEEPEAEEPEAEESEDEEPEAEEDTRISEAIEHDEDTIVANEGLAGNETEIEDEQVKEEDQ